MLVYNSSMQTFKHNSNVTYSSKYHVVWCSKYRRNVLSVEVQNRLKTILSDVCKERSATILALEILEDHVHLLVEVDPQYGIHRLIKQIKGRSSRILRKEFKELTTRVPTLWTNSYFVATVGGAPLSIIKQYVENQKEV